MEWGLRFGYCGRGGPARAKGRGWVRQVLDIAPILENFLLWLFLSPLVSRLFRMAPCWPNIVSVRYFALLFN